MIKLHENISELFEDLYKYLKTQKENGKKVIAYFGHEFIPPELIEASGAVAFKLIFAGNEEFMTIGADYLGPTSCIYARSLIGMFEKRNEIRKYKFLNLVDGIIISNYCTSNLLAAEAISKYFNIKGIEFFIPYRIEQYHLNYYKEQLIALGQELSKFTGIEINDAILKSSIVKHHNFRREIAKINDLPIDAQKKQFIYYDSILFGPDEIDIKEIKEITEIADNLIGIPTSCRKKDLQNIIHLQEFVINKVPSANGMILNHILKFCDVIGYGRQERKEKLTKNNLIVINLERDYSSESSGQIKTRIEAFLEMGK